MDPFVAEIRFVAFNFAPTQWAFCNGQTIAIAQNTALFSLLGTTYGGNGMSNFQLPDLQGRCAIHQGQGPGLTERFLGEMDGSASVTLITSELPVHVHSINGLDFIASSAAADLQSPDSGTHYAVGGEPQYSSALAQSAADGGTQPHNNMPPYLTLIACIALQGVFPQRP